MAARHLPPARRAPVSGSMRPPQAEPPRAHVRPAAPPPADAPIIHNLYVKIVAEGDPDTRSRAFTLEILQFVHANLPRFREMGLELRVNRVTAAQLRDERVRAAMVGRGIKSLPALITPNGAYLGGSAIRAMYERNFAEFDAFLRRGEAPATGAAPTDELEDFYREEMTAERAREDEKDDDAIGEGADMMDAYRRLVKKREESAKKHKPRGAGHIAEPPRERDARDDPPRAAPPRTAGARRPDNVARVSGPPPAGRPADDEEAEIQDTIDRLARDIDDNLRTAAFNGGGSDSYEGGEEPADDLMEQAYWARATDSAPSVGY